MNSDRKYLKVKIIKGTFGGSLELESNYWLKESSNHCTIKANSSLHSLAPDKARHRSHDAKGDLHPGIWSLPVKLNGINFNISKPSTRSFTRIRKKTEINTIIIYAATISDNNVDVLTRNFDAEVNIPGPQKLASRRHRPGQKVHGLCRLNSLFTESYVGYTYNRHGRYCVLYVIPQFLVYVEYCTHANLRANLDKYWGALKHTCSTKNGFSVTHKVSHAT